MSMCEYYMFKPCDERDFYFYFYLSLYLIGTTPISTDIWSDLDKQGDCQERENSRRELRRTPDVKSRPTKIQKGLRPQLIMSCAPFRLMSQDFGMEGKWRSPEV